MASTSEDSIDIEFVCYLKRTKGNSDIKTRNYIHHFTNSEYGLQTFVEKRWKRDVTVEKISESENKTALDIVVRCASRIVGSFQGSFSLDELKKCVDSTLKHASMKSFECRLEEKRSRRDEKTWVKFEETAINISTRIVKLKLCVPRSFLPKIISVGILFDDRYEIHLSQAKPQSCFFEASVRIPLDTSAFYSYFIEIDDQKKFLYFFSQNERRIASELQKREFGSRATQRDVLFVNDLLKENVYNHDLCVDCISEHVLDILHNAGSLEEKLCEMETLVTADICLESIAKVLKRLTNVKDVQCFALILIYLCKNEISVLTTCGILPTWITSDDARSFVECFEFIPDSFFNVTNKCPELIFDICRKASGFNLSVVQFINKAQRCLTLQAIANLLDSKKHLLKTHYNKPDMEKALNLLCQRRNEVSVPTLMHAIIGCIDSTADSTYVLKLLRRSLPQNDSLLREIETMTSNLLIKAVKGFERWSKWNEIQRQLQFLDTADLSKELTACVEDIICRAVATKLDYEDDFCELIAFLLRSSDKSILRSQDCIRSVLRGLLKTISQSRVSLFRLFLSSERRVSDDKEMENFVEAWFDMVCLLHSAGSETEANFKSILRELGFVTNLPYYAATKSHIDSKLKSVFKQEHAICFLNILCDVDGMQDEVRQTYIRHMRRLIHSGRASVLPLLRTFAKEISTRMHVELVETILCAKDFQESFDKGLVALIPHLEDWVCMLSCTGKYSSELKSNAILSSVERSLRTAYDDLLNDRFSLQELEMLKSSRENFEKAFCTIVNEDRSKISSVIQNALEISSRTQRDLETMISTVGLAESLVEAAQFRESLRSTISHLQDVRSQVCKGSIILERYKTLGLNRLLHHCCLLKSYVYEETNGDQKWFPQVYWRVNREAIMDFGAKSEKTFNGCQVIEFMASECSNNYIAFIKTAFDSTASLQRVLEVFHNMGVDEIAKELNFAKRFVRFDGDSASLPIMKVFTLDAFTEKIVAVKQLQASFSMCMTKDLDKKFNLVISVKDRSVPEVDESIKTFISLLDILIDQILYFDKNFCHLLNVLVHSTELLAFLQEIKGEDIRNLLDAAEGDHFDQYLPVISHLIEVKELLSPFIESIHSSDILDACEVNVCDAISILFRSYKKADIKKAAAKCDECSNLLHNLKDFYRTFENRTEKTKDKIRSIAFQSWVHITLSKNFCQYEIESKTTGFVYNKAELSDLRSRALLIQSRFEKSASRNPEIYSDDVFHDFLRIVDRTWKISETYVYLSNLGHPLYLEVEEKLSSTDLDKKFSELQRTCASWEDELERCRESCEVINFIKSSQLPVVYRYLISDVNEAHALSVLDYINPNLREKVKGTRLLSDEWNPLNYICRPSQVLDIISTELERIYASTPPRRRNIGEKILRTKTHDFDVRSQRILFIRLEKDSSNVLHTVLSLYHKIERHLPAANELLLCNESTSLDEIQLLLRRCHFKENHPKRTHCIAFTEYLPMEILYSFATEVMETDFTPSSILAIVYRGKETDTFPAVFKDFEISIEPLTCREVSAIFINIFPDVQVITSDFPGQGKTEAIMNGASDLGRSVKTLHISGPIDRSELIERLQETEIKEYHCLHLDIGLVEKPDELDTFIFELVVMGYVSSNMRSYALSRSYVAIEISSTVHQTLVSDLPFTMCFRSERLCWKNFKDFCPQKSDASPVQVVCSYLEQLNLDRFDSDIDLSRLNHSSVSDERCRMLLQKYFKVTEDASFTQVNVFLNVLASQLKKMSSSSFFRYSHLQSMAGIEAHNLKKQILQTMVSFSNEFATRSITSSRYSQVQTAREIGSTRKSDKLVMSFVSRTKEMVRWESSNHLVLVFHRDYQTVSALYRALQEVPDNIKQLFAKQIDRPLLNFGDMQPIDLLKVLIRISRTKDKWLTEEESEEIIKAYALTPDNLLKMVLILLRIQAHIPVVVMGETGCGKTSLIRKLAQICNNQDNLAIFAVHAGVEEKDIIAKVGKVNSMAKNDYSVSVWLFFDEINTNEHIGLLSDIVCHHKLKTDTLAPNLHILCACNPYRMKDSGRTYEIGLRGKVKEDRLSQLAYRVYPLPEIMLDYVWDYGALPPQEEKVYIRRMIGGIQTFQCVENVFVNLLTASQQFVREKEGSSCTVSLRDVERAKILAEWFKKDFLQKLKISDGSESEKQIRPIILALTVCYLCRFPKSDLRDAYRERLASICSIDIDEISCDKIYNMTAKVQELVMEKMDIPAGVARNTALQENVFLILICILNKIPLFLVGKPGCSKSLSMQLIRNNMRGPDSKDDLFKSYPRLYYSSFQGSESSTSEGILKVFDRAKKYQTEDENVLSLVILDEVGLAEISRFNPLKVLHSLLEPDGKTPDVAVVGISNWALDAAKMNRAVHLSRPQMNLKELLETAISIRRSICSEAIHDSDQKSLRAMTEAYLLYTENQPIENFHGLRDFYSFIKFISKETSISLDRRVREQSNGEDFSQELWMGIKRNFGGIRSNMKEMFETFRKKLGVIEDVHISVEDLIRENLRDYDSRHLMLILDGDAAIGSLNGIIESEGKEKTFILGSKFEDDQDDDYNYRVLNKIILCMEQPHVLILKDLENIYGSLYDMLNQNYTVVQNKKHCRVALGPYSNPTCEVHDQFKCVVLIDERHLKTTDPPFLNRFEKQQFSLLDTVSKNHSSTEETLKTLIKQFASVSDNFTEKDAFAVYGDSFVASLIGVVEKHSREYVDTSFLLPCIVQFLWIARPDAALRLENSILNQKYDGLAKLILRLYFSMPIHDGLEHYLQHFSRERKRGPLSENDSKLPDSILNEFQSHSPSLFGRSTLETVENEVRFSLSDSSSPELENELHECWTPPFANMETLDESLNSLSTNSSNSLVEEKPSTSDQLLMPFFMEERRKCLVVFTYSTIYTDIGCAIKNIHHRLIKLGEMKSEREFAQQIDEFWMSENEEFLVIQCNTKDDLQHILFAKTSVENSLEKHLDENPNDEKFVCLLLHVARSTDSSDLFSKINFLSGWTMATLDSVESHGITLKYLYGKSVQDALGGDKHVVKDLVRKELPNALSMIRHTQSTEYAMSLLETITKMHESSSFLDIVTNIVFDWIRYSEEVTESTEWVKLAASDKHLLYTSATMIGSLKSYLANMIRQPLAMALYKLEDINSLEALLSLDTDTLKKDLFVNLLQQNEIFDLRTVPRPTGPGCYIVQSHVSDLKVPFVKYYFEKFERFKENVLEDLRKSNVVPHLISEEDNISEIEDVVNSVISLYIPIYEKDIVLLDITLYPKLREELIDDFCNYIASQHSCRMSLPRRIATTKWVITKLIEVPETSFEALVVTLFVWSWIYSSRLTSVLQLVDLTPDSGAAAVTNLQCVSSPKSFAEDVETLLENVCLDILPTMKVLSSLGIQDWQAKVYTCIASLASMGIETPKVFVLKLFSDLVSVLFLPYDIPSNEVHKLASVVGQHRLASRDTFEHIHGYFSALKDVDPLIVQDAYFLYISRAQESDTNSCEVIGYVLDKICEGDLFDGTLHNFGPCLRAYLYDYQSDYEENDEQIQSQFFYQILSNESDSLIQEDSVMTKIDIIFKKSSCDSLACIMTELLEKHIYSALITTDRLIAVESRGDHVLQRLALARTILKRARLGLQYICAVSFAKVFLRTFLDAILNRKTRNRYIIEAFNHLFSDLDEREGGQTAKRSHYTEKLINYFLHHATRKDGMFTLFILSRDVFEDVQWFHNTFCGQEKMQKQPEFYHLLKINADTVLPVLKCEDAKELEKYVSQCILSEDTNALMSLCSVLQKKLFLNRLFQEPFDSDIAFGYNVVRIATEHEHMLPDHYMELLKMLTSTKMDFLRQLGCMKFTCMQTVFLCNWYCFLVCFSQEHSAFVSLSNNRLALKRIIEEASCKERSYVEYKLHECRCGFRVIATTDHYEKCVMCSSKSERVKSLTEYIEEDRNHHSHVILQLLVHCTYLFPSESTNSDDDTDRRHSEKEATRLWNQLTEELGLRPSELTSLLMIFLCSSREMFSITSLSHGEWEEKYAENIKQILRKRYEILDKTSREIVDVFSLKTDEFVDDTSSQNDFIPNIFESTEDTSFASLHSEVILHSENHQHRLLKLVFDHQRDLVLPKLLFGVLEWHRMLVTKCRHKIKKVECRFLSVGAFIQQQPRDQQPVIRKKFKVFTDTWSTIRKSIDVLRKYTSDIPEVGLMTEESMLDSCVLKDSNSLLYKVIDALATVQNRLVHSAMVIAADSHSDSPLSFLKPCSKIAAVPIISVMDLRERHLIDLNLADHKSLLEFSQSATIVNDRRTIHYDTRAIEADLAYTLIHDKPYIDFVNSILFVEFKDDLYSQCVQLLRKIEISIPQKQISDELSAKVRERSLSDPTLIPELLRLVGTIAILLDRGIQCNPVMTLLEFLETYVGNVLQTDYKRLLPSKEYDLTISHVVSFYMLLEEMNGENFLESLGEEFKTKLNVGDDADIKEKVCPYRSLLTLYTNALKLFTHRFLYIRDNNISPDQKLADFMIDPILWKGKLRQAKRRVVVDEVEYDFDEIIPGSLAIEHIYCLTELLTRKLKEDEERTSIPIRVMSAAQQRKKTKRTLFRRM